MLLVAQRVQQHQPQGVLGADLRIGEQPLDALQLRRVVRPAGDLLLQLGQLQQLLAADLGGQLADDAHVLADGAGQLAELRVRFDEVLHVGDALDLLMALGAYLEVVHQRLDRLANLAKV